MKTIKLLFSTCVVTMMTFAVFGFSVNGQTGLGDKREYGWYWDAYASTLELSTDNRDALSRFVIEGTAFDRISKINVGVYGHFGEDNPVEIEISGGVFSENFGMNRLDSNVFARVSLKIFDGDFKCTSDPFFGHSNFLAKGSDWENCTSIVISGGDFGFDPADYVPEAIPVFRNGAKWLVGRVNLGFDPNGGTVSVGQKLLKYGDPYGELPVPVREGFEFVAWQLDGVDVAAEDRCFLHEATIATAHWEVKSRLTVKANNSHGAVSGSGDYLSGEKVTVKATAKSGYVFAGWFTDRDCTKKLNPEGYDNRNPKIKYAMPEKDVKVYAKFVSKAEDKKALKFSAETRGLAKTAASYAAGKTMAALTLGASSASLPTLSVKGLPKRMSFDPATGAITGKPTKPGKYAATVTAKSAAGNKVTQDVKIYVIVPSGYYGTFDGYALVGTTPAYATFTSDKYGKVSGKVTYKGKGYAFAANYSSSSASKSAFTPSIKIGSTTYKPVTYVEKLADGVMVSQANGEQKDKFVFVAQKKPGLIKSKKVLAGLIDQTMTVKAGKYADAKLPKSSDYLKLKFAATDAVKVTGKIKGRSVSFSTTVVYCRAEVTEAGDVYTAEAALIEPKLGYSRLATFTLTAGADGKVTKKVSFGKIK